MSSSIGTCDNCERCNQDFGYVCKLDGDFFTTGEYARIIDFFDIHGVSFNQKIDSVKLQLDPNTIQILKVLIADNDLPIFFIGNTATKLDIITAFDLILSRLSNDNKLPILSEGDDV